MSIKETIQAHKKKIVAVITAIVVAIGSVVQSDIPITDAITIAFDAEKAIEHCEAVLRGGDSVPTPPAAPVLAPVSQ